MINTKIACEVFIFIILGLSLLEHYKMYDNIPLNPYLSIVIVFLSIMNKILLITLPSVLCIYVTYIWNLEQKMKKLSFFAKPIKHFQGECSICLGDHNDNDIFSKTNKCDHVFHTKCINEWIITCKKLSCPLCRSYLV